ncbi:PREDICTED: epididymal-specific lipocalin-12 isoform X2 [Propithecus coquereli]|uniref:epididymal-specific lipocalin-12 isoform X2 n=1 Tax=Propithecus coquereli TaxID=379532 RepID=UPI00063F5D81|nr:PREDICTED: epididymal-specific lipocalin-12 isoform X2 [Propithecus coquereli]
MSLGAPPAWWERQGAACSRKYLQDLAGWQPRWNSHAHPHRHIRQEERHRSCQRWGRRPHPLSSPGGSRTGSRCTVSSSAQGCPEACPDPGAEGQEVARMGPWCALWLLLTLPDVLWGQVLNPLPVQLGMQSFQGDQVRSLPGREAAGWGPSVGGEEAMQAGVVAQGVRQVSSRCQGPRPCSQDPRTSPDRKGPWTHFPGSPVPSCNPCTRGELRLREAARPAPLAQAQPHSPERSPGSELSGADGRGSPPGHRQPLQFQGEWFVLCLASNTYGKEHKALLGPFTATFELTAHGHFQVSNAMTRGRRCHTWSYEMIPEAQPGQFAVEHGSGPGTDREEIQVVDSDYTSFALVLSRRPAGSLTIIRVSLLGRSWVLPQGTVDKFICLGRTHGLSEDNIAFPNLAGWLPQAGTC